MNRFRSLRNQYSRFREFERFDINNDDNEDYNDEDEDDEDHDNYNDEDNENNYDENKYEENLKQYPEVKLSNSYHTNSNGYSKNEMDVEAVTEVEENYDVYADADGDDDDESNYDDLTVDSTLPIRSNGIKETLSSTIIDQPISYSSPNQKNIESFVDLRFKRYEQIKPYEDFAYRVEMNGKPPKTEAGIKILKSDIRDCNNRVHELLIRLRMTLAMKSGIACSLIDHSLQEYSGEIKFGSPIASTKGILSAASLLADTFKDEMGRFISAMAKTFRPGEIDRIYLGFLLFHRLLHPFSTDSVYSSIALLSALQYQVQESKSILELFPTIEERIVLSRTLFISDPHTALAWNPLAQPMPMMPNVPNETVFTCLLRVYSIRRDTSSFMRIIWQQAIPSIIAITEPQHASDISSHSFKNLLSVANRILECVLREDVAFLFPPIALTVCQIVFEVGGIDSIHVYLLNCIILPNLLKLLRGDHESIENEAVHDKYSVNDLINQYYNLDIWWPIQGFESVPFNPVNTLVWLVWRLYTGATLLETKALEILTCEGFFAGGPMMDLSRVADQKIRNILVRLQHSSDKFCKALLRQTNHLQTLRNNNLSKPTEMLSLTLISKEEIAWISRDILNEIELGSQDRAIYNHNNLLPTSPKSTSFHDLLKTYIGLDESLNTKISVTGEDFLLLTFDHSNHKYSNHNHRQSQSKYSFDDNDDYDDENNNSDDRNKNSEEQMPLSDRYNKLYNNLVMCNRYEDSLIRMIQAVNRVDGNIHLSNPDGGKAIGCLVDLKELIQDKSWYTSPECILDFIVPHVDLYDRHTEAFRKKQREPHHGFDRSSFIPTDNQHAVPMIQDIENKSLQSLNAEMEKTLRFGTSSEAVATMTSIARSKHRISKPSTKVNDDDFILGQKGYRARYTKSVIHPASALLIPTEAQRAKKPKVRPNRFDIDKEFRESMRTYQVQPTDQFLRRFEAIAKSRWGGSRNSSLNHATISDHKPAPKPFPAYLRNIIRKSEPEDSNSNSDNPLDLAHLIIHDYQNIFLGGNNSNNNNNNNQLSQQQNQQNQQNQYIYSGPSSNSDSPDVSYRKRYSKSVNSIPYRSHSNPRTPLPPEPVPGTSHLAPTQSLLNRCVLSKELLDELDNQNKYASRVQGRAFRPAGPAIVPTPASREMNYWSDDGDDNRDSISSGRYSLGRRSNSTGKKQRGGSNSIDSNTNSNTNSNSNSSLNRKGSSKRRSRSRSPSYRNRKNPIVSSDIQVHDTIPLQSNPSNNLSNNNRGNDINQSMEYGSSEPSPITYKMEYNQPSTEYVPINRNQSTITITKTTPPLRPYDSQRRSKNPFDDDTFIVADGNSGDINSNNDDITATTTSLHYDPVKTVKNNLQRSSLPNQSKPSGFTKLFGGATDSLPPPSISPYREEESTIKPNSYLNDSSTQTSNSLKNPEVKVPIQKIAVIPSRRDWNRNDLKSLLVNGVEAIKHGRTGFAKTKLLTYDEITNQLRWTSTSLFSSMSGPGSISIVDIKEVLRGVNTEVLLKAKQLDPSLCLSILTSDRSLDLVFKTSVDRDKVFKAIEIVIENCNVEDVKFL